MTLELPGSAYEAVKKMYDTHDPVPLILGVEKIADVVITNFVQRYATYDDIQRLGLTVELKAIVKSEIAKRIYKDGAYYWVKLKPKYLYQEDKNPWKMAQYMDKNTEKEEGFRLCNYVSVYDAKDFEIIGDEVLPPKNGDEK